MTRPTLDPLSARLNLTPLAISIVIATVAGCLPKPVPAAGSAATLAPDVTRALLAGPSPAVSSMVGLGSVRLVFALDGPRTQAKVADVSSLHVVLKAAVGSAIERDAPKGASALTIDGIPEGKATIEVTALDTTGKAIGNATAQDLLIVAGQITAVNLTIKLDPTIAPSGSLTPSPGPSSGPATSPAPATGISVQEFVLLASGSFAMGSPQSEIGRLPDEIQHQVTLTHPFYFESTDVTQGQWQALMGSNPSWFQPSHTCPDGSNCPNCPNCPVEQVDWYSALAYANTLSASSSLPPCYSMTGCIGTPGNGDYNCDNGIVSVNATGSNPYLCTGYRLPTEAEWEYAYRAGTTTGFYDGENTKSTYGEEPNLDPIAWYAARAGDKTHPAGLKLPNAWGLYDMAGNAWQWVWDWYGPYLSAPVTDPLGPPTGIYRADRGGSYDEKPAECRAADRGYSGFSPGYRYAFMTFRLARSKP